jgi:hypothetical protein
VSLTSEAGNVTFGRRRVVESTAGFGGIIIRKGPQRNIGQILKKYEGQKLLGQQNNPADIVVSSHSLLLALAEIISFHNIYACG